MRTGMRTWRGAIGVVFGLVFTAATGAVSSCSASSSDVGVADNCSINSDCDSPLICAFGRCHEACAQQRDCSPGERCVATTGGGICQLSTESMCSGTQLCQAGQTCGADGQCRASCITGSNCASGDYCLTSGTIGGACYSPTDPADEPALIAAGVLAKDGAILSDASTVMVSPDGSSDASKPKKDGSSSQDSASDVTDSGIVGNSCPSAQTQFGLVAQGDTNPNFVSGLGIRTATELLIFDDYYGPDPTADAGPDAGMVNYLYVQAFDPVTGKKKRAAQPLFPISIPGISAIGFTLEAAVVAPTGEIAILYSNGCTCISGRTNLSAVFLASTSDAGSSPEGLQLVQTVELEVGNVGFIPRAIWSNAIQAFVFSWDSTSYNGPLKVQNFLPNGQIAGGGTESVPTDQTADEIGGYIGGMVGASGNLFGVAYDNLADNPFLTVLDSLGNEVGNPFALNSTTTSTWSAMGGTRAGFVAFYDLYQAGGIGETLVPVGTDGGVPATQPADGGDAGLPGFHFSGTVSAEWAVAVNDDVGGGVGGVGLAILYPTSISFAYVDSNGLTHVGPNSVIAHTYAGGDYINLNNLGGSFGVSVYSTADKSTQAVASGCTHSL
jgi:hypothetical protein